MDDDEDDNVNADAEMPTLLIPLEVSHFYIQKYTTFHLWNKIIPFSL